MTMQPQLVFKSWVPEWAILAIIFLALLPVYMLLALYGATAADAAGYYGIEPSDVQFSILVFYAGLVAYFPLEPRFSSYLPVRQNLIISLTLMALCVAGCAVVRQPLLLFGLRFGQGVLCGAIASPCLLLIFSRLHSARARAMGYTFFYAAVLGGAPLSGLLSTLILDRFNFPVVFYAFLLLQLPAGLLLVLLLNDVRLKRRVPLAQLEWPSFVFYAAGLVLVAYVLAYGQQRYWLADPGLRGAAGLAVLLLGLFGLRQRHLKRPYINLAVFGYADFRLGLGLFMLFYLCRGTTGLATAYFQTVLGLDARNLAGIHLAQLAGTVLGMALVVRFLLVGTPMRRLWAVGFGLLLVYHGWMYFLLGPAEGAATFWLPFFVQGLGTGTLMVPLIVFTLSSLPSSVGGSGSFVALATRFFAYSLSIGLTGYVQQAWRSAHFERFRQVLVPENTLLVARLLGSQQRLQSHGLAAGPARQAALRLLTSAVEAQSQLRFVMGYYALVGAGLVLLLALLLLPTAHRHLVSFRQRPA